MPRMMYFDCFSGAAGDMVLGALLDAGLPLDALRDALGSLGAGHELRVTRVLRAGISANHVEVLGDDKSAHSHSDTHDDDHSLEHDHSRDHGHSHGPDRGPSAHHVHRSLDQIAHLIDHSALSTPAKARAVSMFRRLAEVEAAIHHMPVEQVHLHEVGAIDSIIDIVGVVFAFDWFGIDDIAASPLNVGGGTVEIAHGTFPVPAPATLRLLQGIPIYSGSVTAELVTPTGALIMSTYAKRFGPLPLMTMERVGYGAGTRDFDKVPNVLRVVIGERADASVSTELVTTQVLKIEAAIDDMNPQLFGPVSEALFEAGALDVCLTSISMKKGRPGTLLTVLAPVSLREAVCTLLFRETTTIGVRFAPVERETLDRTWVEVATPGGSVRIKVARRRGVVVNAAPEFDDCVRIAAATGQPVKAIQAEAMDAWRRIDRAS